VCIFFRDQIVINDHERPSNIDQSTVRSPTLLLSKSALLSLFFLQIKNTTLKSKGSLDLESGQRQQQEQETTTATWDAVTQE
jgi:hypothetical protein